MYAVKKPDKVDPNEKRLGKWLNCALSYEPLREPCMIDKLGNIFNKGALVEALLGKKLPKEFRHIKGLKDMINIKLSMIPRKQSDAADGAMFQCPLTGLEFNGNAMALKEVKSSACLVCHKEFVESDKMVINGSEEEVAALRERMEEEKSKTVKEKKRGIDVVDGKKDCDHSHLVEIDWMRLSNTVVKKFRAADHVTPAKDAEAISASIFSLTKLVDQVWPGQY
ncbi:hypothetical protein Goarm_015494 [Gossypium armourianum]|uniref:Replication termination factor 2 n=1 Tax=Gossypium armourianum TaxID=34283 RepID=A0A7J9J9A8_9ROSI|nr:hypothetical protein [Gossypium armourianum]